MHVLCMYVYCACTWMGVYIQMLGNLECPLHLLLPIPDPAGWWTNPKTRGKQMQSLSFTTCLQVGLSGTVVERSLIRRNQGSVSQVFLSSESLALTVSSPTEKTWAHPALSHWGGMLLGGLLQKCETAGHSSMEALCCPTSWYPPTSANNN